MGHPDREFWVDNDEKMEAVSEVIMGLPVGQEVFTLNEVAHIADLVADKVIEFCGGEIIYEDERDEADAMDALEQNEFGSRYTTKQIVDAQSAHLRNTDR